VYIPQGNLGKFLPSSVVIA